MDTTLITVLAAAFTFAVVLLRPVPASAHCDTEGGPAVADGRRALETGNINHALKWINPEGEGELREAFDRALATRRNGAGAAAAAERAFLESLVRIHRTGEGAGFDGIKPSGAGVDPVIAAADAAVASGSVDDLLALVPADRVAQLRTLFAEVLARRDFDVDDVTAGRDYLAAYVAFFKYAEGEEHHHHPQQHDHHDHHVA